MYVYNIYNKVTAAKRVISLVLVIFAFSTAAFPQEQEEGPAVYDERRPLIYEDAWDLWPYVFLNENGEPDGYNIDLLKMIFKELNIPYVVKLKPTLEAQADLKNGKSNLMLRMDAKFSRGSSHFGKNTIQLFTHSIVYPKKMAISIEKIEDLKDYRIIVHEGSFSHHFLKDSGLDITIEPYDDMKTAIQKVTTDEEGIIVWNTMSLKWLMKKYHTDNLAIAELELPHGEYKFMSKDRHLLHQMDSVFANLRAADRLQPIQNKWFYPEHTETGIPSWIWRLTVIMIIIAIGSLFYYLAYRLREKKMTKTVRMRNNRLRLILRTSHVNFWTYNVQTKTFSEVNNNGKSQNTMTVLEFSHGYRTKDFIKLQQALEDLGKGGIPEKTFSIETAIDEKNPSPRIYTLTLSVLRKTKGGRPSVILCTRSDVTERHQSQQKIKDTMMRYQSIFSSAMIDMAFFDERGFLVDCNEKLCETTGKCRDELQEENISLQSIMGTPDFDINNLDFFYATIILDASAKYERLRQLIRLKGKAFYEMQIVPVKKTGGELLGFFMTGRDVSESAYAYHHLLDNIRKLQQANEDVSNYIKNIDYVLDVGSIRIARYSLDTHILTIYSDVDNVKFRLTQSRIANLVDEQSKRTVQRVLNNMDNRSPNSVDMEIKTTIRKKGGTIQYLQLHFIPEYDKNHRVKDYFGMCRDISEIKALELKLANETLRAQEVEVVKNAFLHNMSFEIRTPLNTIVGFSELFEMEHSPEEETIFIEEIKSNSFRLLGLINDILLLSRLDAGMIEIKPSQTDLATMLESRCEEAWRNIKKPNVNYTVKNLFRKFVVEIDINYTGIILDKIINNAVKNTEKGSVNVRYDYVGDQVIIAVEDTGQGIPESKLETIYYRFFTANNDGAGLGLSICQELLQLMDGSIRVKSAVGRGTTVWVSIPCKVLDIERF